MSDVETDLLTYEPTSKESEEMVSSLDPIPFSGRIVKIEIFLDSYTPPKHVGLLIHWKRESSLCPVEVPAPELINILDDPDIVKKLIILAL
jgi:hypothetical protein